MSIIDTLITDRTLSDVSSGTAKGFYNASDLNRVTEAMEYLDGVFSSLGYITGYSPIEISTGRFEWREEDIPTILQMEQYLSNVSALRQTIALFQSTPQTPDTMKFFTHTKANDIEKILVDIETTINRMISTFVPCGEALCGGDYL